jgi:hypothetical protein
MSIIFILELSYKLIYILGFIFLTLSSCSNNNDNFEKSLKLKRGMSVDNLIKIMGEPDGVYTDSTSYGKELVVYYYFPETVFHSDNIKIFIDSSKISRIDNDME